MNDREAMEALADAELIPLLQGPLMEMKRIWRQCLDEGVPVAAVAPPGRS